MSRLRVDHLSFSRISLKSTDLTDTLEGFMPSRFLCLQYFLELVFINEFNVVILLGEPGRENSN